MAKKTNETYKIKIESPLLRPGLTITTKVSKGYLLTALQGIMEIIRQFNKEQDEKANESKKD